MNNEYVHLRDQVPTGRLPNNNAVQLWVFIRPETMRIF